MITSIALIVSFIGVIFVASSLESLEYDEYGIDYNTITRKVDRSKVYESGLYWLGFGHKFIKFPKILQTVEFSPDSDATAGPLISRTQDGLAVTLEISFQYKLIKSELQDLYAEFNEYYEDTFVRIARDVLRDVTGNYTAISFFNNRTVVGNAMQDELGAQFEEVHATVEFLQLRKVDLPDAFENAIEQAEVARQEIQTALFEQQAALIRAQTAILEAQAQANITIIEANASATAFLIQIEAQAKAVNITLTAERLAYYALAQELGLNSTELLAYLWIQAINNHDSAWLIVGVDAPVIITQPNTDNSTVT